MKRFFSITGGVIFALLLAVLLFFFWASSGHVDAGAEQQIKTYDTAPAAEAETLTVATYNIGYLSGMTNNRPVDPPASLFQENLTTAAALLEEIDADVVGLQEIDFGASRSYGVQQLDTLAARLGYPVAAQATNWDKRYVPFPYWPPAVHFGRMHSGQAVLSRVPIETHRASALVRPPRPFFSDAFYLDRLAQVAVLRVNARPLVVINVHLEAFNSETRQQQARQLRALTDAYLEADVPLLLIGDFNSVFAETLDALPDEEQSRFRDDATMAILRADQLAPGFPVPPSSAGDVPGTYPADAPSRKIDHILYTTDWMTPVARSVRCGPSDAPPADHCAVSLTVGLSPPADAASGESLFDRLPSAETVRQAVAAARP
jgi:endonuclease/exonuclease/phosphatase family metal-dependent hydrolase